MIIAFELFLSGFDFLVNGRLHLPFLDNSGNWGDVINLTEHGINPNTGGA